MKRQKHILLLIVFAIPVSLLSLNSQTIDKIRETSYMAYVKGEIALWEEALDLSALEYGEKHDSTSLFELLLVQYGYAAFCAKEKYRDRGAELIEEGISNVEIYLKDFPDDPQGMAIKAAFMVFEATLFPSKMIANGLESVKLSDKAFSLDSEKRLTLTGKANQLRFTPAIFGGSVDDSLPLYQQIISYYDSGKYSTKNDWMYVNTLVILAGTYEKKKMYEKACEVYEKIILFDDNINWISNGLYPDCLQKAGLSPTGREGSR